MSLTPPVEALFDAPPKTLTAASPAAANPSPAGAGCGGMENRRGTTPAPAGTTRNADIVITVYGTPGPQGSKKPKGMRRTKNGNLVSVLAESSEKVEPWRQDVRAAAIQVAGAQWTPLDGPLAMRVTFTFLRPKGHYRTGRNAHLLRDTAPTRPCVYPDLSKLIRSTEDALTSAGTWADDARVADITAAKRYAGEGPDALDRPGAVIRIQTIGGTP